MKKTLAILLALVLLCGILSACGKAQPEEVTPAEQTETEESAEAAGETEEETAEPEEETETVRTVTDMTGEVIELPETVEHIFVDWGSGVTLATTLGATDKLVCCPTAFETDTFAWARIICPALDSVPKDDDPNTNVEAVLNYAPELVITNTEENIETYQNLGLTAIYVTFNDNDSFKESLRIVGAALGEEEYAAAEKYCEYFDANVAMVTERLSGIDDADKKSVYYLDSRFSDPYHTVGTGEIQEEWITIAGGKLATAGEFEGRNLELTAEKILEIDPDIIVIGAQNQAEVYDLLVGDDVLSSLSAVQNGEVYRLPQGIFPWCRTGPEAALQMVWAGQFLHPECFEDIDIRSVARDFYKEFYGTEVADEYLDEILSGHLCPGGN